jgi:hypothetical protein
MADTPEDFEKIRRNVSKMVSMSAPEADIDAYLQTERLTADEFKTVATGKAKLGDIRMTQQSQGQIARAQSVGQTIPAEGITRRSMLPYSRMEATGEDYFDPDAGILGILKRVSMTPGDVMGGNLDPESEEGARRMGEWAMAVTPAGPASRATQAAVPGTLKSLRLGQPKVPTAQELKAAGSAGFDQARNLGVDYAPEAVKSMTDDIARTLQEVGFDSITAPKTSALLAKAGAIPEADDGAVVTSLNNLISLRKALQEAAGSGDAAERAAASRAIDAVDGFISAADPSSVVAGAASSAGSVLDAARGNYAAAMRSGSVTEALTKAERNAAKSNSGQNLDNTTRQRLESVLAKDTRGWSPEEKQLLDDIVRGKHGANLARRVGNWLGGGGGVMQTIMAGLGATAGHVVGGPGGAIVGATVPAALGTTAKGVSAAITRGQAKKLDEILRMRSPLYQQNAKTPPVVQGINPAIQDIINRALLLQATQQEGQP